MNKSQKSVPRRDGSGHLDAAYAEKLRALSDRSTRETDPDAFAPERISADPLAAELAQSFVRSVTSGEGDEAESLDAVVAEESGGPFVPTTGRDEFARGTDESNPDGALREPFPVT